MKKISVLGSTGSIGTQCLEVAEKYNYTVTALAAGSNIRLLELQARAFRPGFVAVRDEAAASDLRVRLRDLPVKVEGGEDAVIKAASLNDCEIVVNAIVGIAGLRATMAAIAEKKTIALANKETLVAGGDIVMRSALDNNVAILPVDSEHSAIFQCLHGELSRTPQKLILTASGGPFFGMTKDQLQNVAPEDALKHPNWEMGKKISIDSATLMNKGLEVIEAVHLFGVKPDKIEVLIHRQSILHSAVEFCDNSIIGQLGVPDMKIPIQLALTYPERYPCDAPSLSLADIGCLTFERPDFKTFTCLKTCIDAIKAGGLKPAAANGANEIAVQLFLENKIKFLQIGELVAAAAERQPVVENYSMDDVFDADRAARESVLSAVNS